MKILFKSLTKKQLSEALTIYNFYISHSYSNFEEKKLSIGSFEKLYKRIRSKKLPFILAIKNEQIIGLAFINKFREKSGYRFTYEHSIYVDPQFVKQGYGSLILKDLIKQCKKNQNIKNLIAVIGGTDNSASINIHKKYGFRYIGTIIKAGFKKNKWVDSVLMQKRL
tara:strand:+ start:29 stop:529 length:501 start_codon:yes stop_codon:yes gene_type:complete